MGMLDKLRTIKPSTDILPPDGVSSSDTPSGVNWNVAKERHTVSVGKGKPPVKNSPDLERVLALPKRPPLDLDDPENPRTRAIVELMTERLRYDNPNCKCRELGREECITVLKPAQAWELYEAGIEEGSLAPIGVGHGKTGLDILTAMVIPNCKQAVLLIPPNLQAQFERDYLEWSQHFRVPSLVIGKHGGRIHPGRPVLHVVPFSVLSRPESTDLLEQLKPDLFVVDEVQKLRHRDTASTGRFLRYFHNHPETRLCGWSGTITSESINDYAHLLALALKRRSPLPLHPQVVEEWALAIDPSDWPAPAGELDRLKDFPGEKLHAAYHRRLTHTRGVVATKASAIGAPIYLHEKKAPPLPDALKGHLKFLRNTWERPDGEEFVDILQVATCARQLASGFYYRFKYPKNSVKCDTCTCGPKATERCAECVKLILRWFDVRKRWHKELREKLKHRSPFLDSPLLCTQAAIRYYHFAPPPLGIGKPYEGDRPMWEAKTWPEWLAIKELVQPETETVWVDDYLAKDAAEWALKNRGIVWYEYEAFGQRVAELSGLPLHGGGPGAEERILGEKGDRSIIVSINSHGTGRDGLQKRFNDQLIANPPSDGARMEQLLGRLHRIGQKAEEVHARFYRNTAEMIEAVDKAILKAKYIRSTIGTSQKLLSAKCTFDLDRD